MSTTPRLRMFAGPNGSGKSTIKEVVPTELLGVYINPDEIEKILRTTGKLDLAAFKVQSADTGLMTYLHNSILLKKTGLLRELDNLSCIDGVIDFGTVEVNSYFASVIASYIREQLLENNVSFTFETVMSSPDKVEFLQKARDKGFRTYLYFVATEDPQINISRVAHRVRVGGHPVPEEKIIARYYRTPSICCCRQSGTATVRISLTTREWSAFGWRKLLTVQSWNLKQSCYQTGSRLPFGTSSRPKAEKE